MAVNKVVYGSNTLIDLSGDTIPADRLAVGYTAHDASGEPITGTLKTIGRDGITWEELSGEPWGVISDNVSIVLSRTVSYPSAVTSSQLIWPTSELSGLPFTTLTDYEYLSMMAIKTDTTHTTYQVVFSTSFYPYFSYSSNANYVHAGMMCYHGASASAVYNARSSTALVGSVPGYFQIASDGIRFATSSSYALRGTYLFTLSAKLKF